MYHLAEVVGHAAKRDHAAFAELYEYYKRPLCKRLLALVGEQWIAYDLYQDTFVRVWKYFSEQESVPQEIVEHFEPWLYRIMKNVAIDYLRHERIFAFLPLPENESDDPREYALSAHLSVTGHEEQVCDMLCLKQIFGTMSPQYRACLALQAEWGLTQREIAAQLGISEKAVSTNVSRGYKQLRHLYKMTMGAMYNRTSDDLMNAIPAFPIGLGPKLLQLWQEEGWSSAEERPKPRTRRPYTFREARRAVQGGSPLDYEEVFRKLME